MQDRTVRPVIATTLGCQPFQGAPHLVQLCLFQLQLGGTGQGQRLNVRTGPGAVVPESKQPANLINREAKIASAANRAKRVNVTLIVIPVSGVTPCRSRNEADFLVMPDHSLTDARRC